MKSLLLILITSCLFVANVNAQQSSNILRGSIVDNITEGGIPGVKITVLNSDPLLRTLSTLEGDFLFPKMAIGKFDVLFQAMGYEDYLVSDLTIKAGKETVLNIKLIEDIQTEGEIDIVANKNTPKNEMSVVSTRTFSVEQTQKYAASLNDPARMATSFAGVVGTNGINNDISIRGNSPNGIIWRMEGIEIPNPNHFSAVGTSGGGISILSAQLLGTSDFSTGAFAAEYGNALSGVFDLSLRKGNNQKREYTIQAGVLGIDLSAEGPFKKGYKGSYLINYRYSSLSLMQKLMDLGDDETNFQDLSFNIYLPTKKIGDFGLFGFGGLSDVTQLATLDTVLWQTEPWRRYEGVFKANTAVLGAYNKLRIGNKGILKTNLAYSITNNGDYADAYTNSYENMRLFTEDFRNSRLTVSTIYKQKISAKSNFKTGVIVKNSAFSLKESERIDSVTREVTLDQTGNTQTVQAFFQYGYKLNKKLSINGGVHYLQLLLNNSNSLEPRLSVAYQPKSNHRITVGYGAHSQIQPLGTYFAQVENEQGLNFQPNKNLKLNKAQHYVVGYKFQMNENHSIGVEVYYQGLKNIPVNGDDDSTYSTINDQEGFELTELYQTGLGRNYGAELTLERSMKNDFYYLISTSLFESKYRAFNNTWYDTRFNTKYIFTATGGKEWVLKNTEKRRVFGINLKTTFTGGLRFTPANVVEVDGEKYPAYDFSQNNQAKMPAFFRTDLQFSLKRDFKNSTSTLSLDLRNVTNHMNVAGQYFNEDKGTIERYYHDGLLPILSYKINF